MVRIPALVHLYVEYQYSTELLNVQAFLYFSSSHIRGKTGNLVIYRSVVGDGWGKNSNNLGQDWGKVGAQGMVGVWLGHGQGTGHAWGRVKGWGMVGA